MGMQDLSFLVFCILVPFAGIGASARALWTPPGALMYYLVQVQALSPRRVLSLGGE